MCTVRQVHNPGLSSRFPDLSEPCNDKSERQGFRRQQDKAPWKEGEERKGCQNERLAPPSVCQIGGGQVYQDRGQHLKRRQGSKLDRTSSVNIQDPKNHEECREV